MFTALSVIIFISILRNGNLSNNDAATMLAFGWILFLGVGLLLDGIVLLSIISLIILIAVGIFLLVGHSRNKTKRTAELKNGYKEGNVEDYGGKTNGK